jgi:hypothetical protein
MLTACLDAQKAQKQEQEQLPGPNHGPCVSFASPNQKRLK